MPTPDELAKELGVTVKEVQTLLRANSDNFSLNAELDDESHTELAERHRADDHSFGRG